MNEDLSFMACWVRLELGTDPALVDILKDEYMRMLTIAPALARNPLFELFFRNRSPKFTGRYSAGRVSISATAAPYRAWLEDARERRAHGQLQKLVQGRTARTVEEWAKAALRHEIAHHLVATAPTKQVFPAVAKWRRLKRTWIAKNISLYAAENFGEFMAEIITLYTDQRYSAGDLPTDLEGLARDVLGQQGTEHALDKQ